MKHKRPTAHVRDVLHAISHPPPPRALPPQPSVRRPLPDILSASRSAVLGLCEIAGIPPNSPVSAGLLDLVELVMRHTANAVYKEEPPICRASRTRSTSSSRTPRTKP